MGARAAGATTPPPWLTCGDGFITMRILARPGSTRRGIIRLDPRGLVIALNAAPDKGKANDELIAYLARTLKLPRASIAIVSGATSRNKTIRIASAEPAKLAAIVSALAAAQTSK